MRTAFPQISRAFVAKLRTQNADMVLAKAKLFDEQTSKEIQTRRMSVKIPRVRELKDDTIFATPNKATRKKHGIRPKNNNTRLKQNSPYISPLTNMEYEFGYCRKSKLNLLLLIYCY